VEKQIVIIYAGTNGLLDDIEVPDVRPFELSLYRFLDTTQAALLQKIREKKAIDDDIKAALEKAIKDAKEKFKAERGRAA
jgi:F-type H+-transporting ATPase subunit alpha